MRDEGSHRYSRGKNRLDDVAHGGVESAGRVNLEHDELRAVAFGASETTGHEIGCRRTDRASQRQNHHWRGCGRRRIHDPRERGQHDQSEQHELSGHTVESHRAALLQKYGGWA